MPNVAFININELHHTSNLKFVHAKPHNGLVDPVGMSSNHGKTAFSNHIKPNIVIIIATVGVVT